MSEQDQRSEHGRSARTKGTPREQLWLAAVLSWALWLGGSWLIASGANSASKDAVRPFFLAWQLVGLCAYVYACGKANSQMGARGLGFVVLLLVELFVGWLPAAVIAHSRGFIELFP